MNAWAFLIAMALKASVVLAVAWCLTAWLRRSSAATRHQLLATALISVLLLPLWSAVLPAWRVGIPAAGLISPVSVVNSTDEPVARSLVSTAPSAEPSLVSRPPLNHRSRTTVASERPSSVSRWMSGMGLTWSGMLVDVWLLGSGLLLTRLFAGIAGAWWIGRRARVVNDASWLQQLQEAARRLNISRAVELRMMDEAMPSSCGLWRSFLLLPSAAADWDDSRRSVVLLHELAHVRRRDCQIQFLAQLACIVHWFNPLVWMAAARLRSEREQACDDLVLGAGTRNSEYAMHLLDIARDFRKPVLPSLATVSMARPSQLEGRLLAILDASRSRRVPTPRRATGALLAVAALVLPVAAIQPSARPVANLSDLQGIELDDGTVETEMPTVPGPVAHAVEQASASGAAQAEAARPVPQPAAPAADRADRTDQQRRLVDALVTALSDQDADVRKQAAATLATLRDPRAIDGLTVALKDRDPDVREEAVSGLAQMRAPSAAGPLLLALKDESGEVRAKAAYALGELRDPRSADALTSTLEDPDAEVREQAVYALGRLRLSASLEPLQAALKDPDADVRQHAANALAELEDPRSTDALIGALSDADADVRQQAAFGLAKLRAPSAVTPLIRALADSDAEVRQQAAFALSGLRDPRAVDSLIGALKDRMPEVRQQAAFALSQLRASAAVGPLIATLKDQDGEVRQQAAFALGQIRSAEAIDPLTAALQDPDDDVRQQVAFALGQLMGKNSKWNVNPNPNHNSNR